MAEMKYTPLKTFTGRASPDLTLEPQRFQEGIEVDLDSDWEFVDLLVEAGLIRLSQFDEEPKPKTKKPAAKKTPPKDEDILG